MKLSSEDVLNRLKAKFPDVGSIKIGYIGNIERWGDDRQWKLWFDDIKVRDVWGNNSLSTNINPPPYTEQEYLLLEEMVEKKLLRAMNHD